MRLLLSICLSQLSGLAIAETYEVKMLNRNDSGSMVYDPPYLNVEPGDTVKFIAKKRGHNAASIDGMIPVGAEPFKGKTNEEIEVTFEVDGLYGVKCTTHFAMGMVMLVEVGEPKATMDNTPEDLPRRAAERFRTYLGHVSQ
ncbi:pseudoazurin [Roseibium sp. HPY-6]|uniref:pseudoazurin n=1 Tax=Roseibium sp. HPY-6 TaxID=3229852 RepID=UPI00338D5C9C